MLASSDDVFTPELLDMLARIVSASSLSDSDGMKPFDKDVSGIGREHSTGIYMNPSQSIESVDTTTPQSSEGAPDLVASLFDLPVRSVSNPEYISSSVVDHPLSPQIEQSTSTPTSVASRQGRYKSNDFNPRAPVQVSWNAVSSPTTLMLKNIPNRISREMLADEIMKKLPVGSFDFLYLPIDFQTRAGFGYAFINMTSDANVNLFVSEFHKRRLSSNDQSYYSKPVEVTVARVQGFNANINRLIASPVLFLADEGSLPLIFNAHQMPIPFKALMQLNRASILFQQRPSIDELLMMVEDEVYRSSSEEAASL